MNELHDRIGLLPILVPVMVLSLTLHELAHGIVAYWLGDRTAKSQGRLSLNPLRHLDPWGSILFLVTFLLLGYPFGWAKPVPIAPWQFRRLKRPQIGMAIVGAAGPITNLIIALVLIFAFFSNHAPAEHVLDASSYLGKCTILAVQLNVVLAVFNMIPVPPLDGSRVVGAFMSRRIYADWAKLDEYAPIFLFLLVFLFRNQLGLVLQSGTFHVETFLLKIANA